MGRAICKPCEIQKALVDRADFNVRGLLTAVGGREVLSIIAPQKDFYRYRSLYDRQYRAAYPPLSSAVRGDKIPVADFSIPEAIPLHTPPEG